MMPAARGLLLFVLGGTLIAPRGSGAQEVPEADTAYQTYRDVFSLSLGLGLRMPGYDRVDGVILPWGPEILLAGDRLEVDPVISYRSDLGALDPRTRITLHAGGGTRLTVVAGRETFTNDAWIRSSLANSLAALGAGSDARNYFRADRVTGELAHRITRPTVSVGVSAGILHEHAWSTGNNVPGDEAPWSLLRRTDSLGLRRVNPAISKGHTTSGIAGALLMYESGDMRGSADVRFEKAFDTPRAVGTVGDPDGFSQISVDARLGFLTFGAQNFAFRGHAVLTPGPDAPAQRHAYLGGSGTLATVDLLAFGGDHLLYVEGDYRIPLSRPEIRFLGPPTLNLRYAAGSAGIGELPRFIQNLSGGVSISLLKMEYSVDPAYRDNPFTRRSAFSVSLTLSL